jgi:hypothetical protein
MHIQAEYASDEEDRKGQDDGTVRPPDPAGSIQNGQVIVQAVFFFANSRLRLGAVTLHAGSDPSGQSLMKLPLKDLHAKILNKVFKLVRYAHRNLGVDRPLLPHQHRAN